MKLILILAAAALTLALAGPAMASAGDYAPYVQPQGTALAATAPTIAMAAAPCPVKCVCPAHAQPGKAAMAAKAARPTIEVAQAKAHRPTWLDFVPYNY